ncbi:MAG: hypothetical protein ACFFAK_11345 [Promethearchaeota archaeon]
MWTPPSHPGQAACSRPLPDLRQTARILLLKR